MKSGGNISGFKESGGAIQHVMTIRLVGPPLDELAVVGGLLDDTGRVDGKRVIAPHAKRMVDMGGVHNCSRWALIASGLRARKEQLLYFNGVLTPKHRTCNRFCPHIICHHRNSCTHALLWSSSEYDLQSTRS